MRPSLQPYLASKSAFTVAASSRLTVTVHDARDGVEFGVADPDLDLRLRLDVAPPVGDLALGNKVGVPAVLGEPDLDLTRLTRDAAGGGQVEVLEALSDYQHITYPCRADSFAAPSKERSAVAQATAFGQRPLSRASRPFVRSTLEGQLRVDSSRAACEQRCRKRGGKATLKGCRGSPASRTKAGISP